LKKPVKKRVGKANPELQEIPGIGPSLEIDLHLLGIRHIADLKKQDPQEMYERLCKLTHSHQDRCVLYVFRCAIYYASNARHDPEKLKWWNWSDAKI
jgi:hypothetical protein